MRFDIRKHFALPVMLTALLTFGLAAGCDREEEVLDVETGSGELEVDEDTETGQLEVETEDY